MKYGSKVFKLLAAIAIIAQMVMAQTREITFNLYDEYGDGWDGAALRVTRNGNNLTPNPTIGAGHSAAYTLEADIGDLIQVYWIAADRWNDECAFAIYYSDSPPFPAFNPAANATNDTENILIQRLYNSLSNTTTGTLLGSFTVVKAPPRISVSPNGVTLSSGETRQFTAVVSNFDNPNQTVSWSVSGSTNAATSINQTTGVLTIADSETATSLTIRATSNADPSLFGSATVGVRVPYRIGTAAELAAFADSINSGRNFTGRLVILTADINLYGYGATNTAFNSGRGWIPIGNSTNPFRGEFDGNGYVIRGLYINQTTRDYAGLFGQIGSVSATGIVRNIALEDVDITAGEYAGGVVGLIRGYGTNVGGTNQQDFHSTLTNVYVTGTINGYQYVGGIAGSVSSWGHVESAYSTADVISSARAGGIAGYLDGEIRGSVALGPRVRGASSVGRIAGSTTTYSSLVNNAAWDEMLNNAGTDTWSSKGPNLPNGADITSDLLLANGTLGGRFAHAPWVTENGKLPGFRAPVSLPEHISKEPPTVTSVSVTPQDTVAVRGKASTIQFSAAVLGTGKPDQTVTWSIAGKSSSGTNISLTGNLTVASNETADLITITATSVANPAISGTATVPLMDAAVTSVNVTPQNAYAVQGRGSTIQFSAVVAGIGGPDQDVTWSVAGKSSSGTNISTAGLLTVASNETADLITITATSVMDSTISGTAKVPILDINDGMTPVERNGRLSVNGNRIINEHGDIVQLRGMSLFWSMASEGRDYYNANVVNWLADDWKVSVVRAAMGVDEDWDNEQAGYLNGDNSGGVSNKQRVTDVVEAAIAKGIYVIIDWHSHQAHSNTNAAKAFFEEMAERYKDVPNVIYEIYNEPVDVNWATIRTYSQTVVNAIRAIDPHNIIILGTPNWSQDVDVATLNPVTGNNLTYSLHFYAYSHGASIRTKATTALNRNYALFVSEFGTCHASGNTPIDTAATTIWLNFLDQHKTSWVNWSVSDKDEAASILKSDIGMTNGKWTADDLTLSGRYIRNKLITAHEAEFFTLPRLLTYKTDLHGKIRVGAVETLVDEYTARTAPGTNGPQITAMPNDGYEFAGWSDGSTANPRQDLHAWNNISVTANFLAITTSIIANPHIPILNTPIYYNLRGQPLGVQKPTVPGVYIEYRPGVAKRIVVR
ncbi:MAG: cellulase family glycosylhydrolase [Fibromonadaceae bacterium]|nr:cellulase family glycosylhydrolase [Fibromonadaceae bacterium]